MSDMTLGRPRVLQRDDRCEDFDCGSEPLNDYLQRFAWTNQQAYAARTCHVEPAMLCQSPIDTVGQQPHQPRHDDPASCHVDAVLATENSLVDMFGCQFRRSHPESLR